MKKELNIFKLKTPQNFPRKSKALKNIKINHLLVPPFVVKLLSCNCFWTKCKWKTVWWNSKSQVCPQKLKTFSTQSINRLADSLT